MSYASLIDRPLGEEDVEALGLTPYAEAMAEFITGCESPITIGIQGDWGIGKTSLLNMVRSCLKKAPGRARFPTIYVNTWQYAQFEQDQVLALVMLRAIVEQIRSEFPQHWTEKARDAGGWLLKTTANALNQLGRETVGVDALAAAGASPDGGGGERSDLVVQYKRQFETLVREVVPKGKGQLVIMIDDLDRVPPARALELLEAVKVFLDVEGCVFILAVDYNVIQRGVKEKMGVSAQELHGKSFFDKIIQVPFNMPVAAYQTDRYIMSLLGWELPKPSATRYKRLEGRRGFIPAQGKVDADDALYFANITRLTVGSNPRSIKRAVNYANLLRIIVDRQREQVKRAADGKTRKKEWTKGDAKLLFPLACMQLAWPEVFAFFCRIPTPGTLRQLESWDFLESLPEAQRVFNRSHDPEQTRSNMTGFIDQLKALIDTGGGSSGEPDGEIQPGEFQPIWSMMQEANLTSVALEDLDTEWTRFEKSAARFVRGRWEPGTLRRMLGLFRDGRSRWSSRVHFRLVSAGAHSCNMLWDRRHIGSVVTTGGWPLRAFVELRSPRGQTQYEVLCGRLPEATSAYLEDWAGRGHYGSGDVLIKLWEVIADPAPTDRMNEILAALIQD